MKILHVTAIGFLVPNSGVPAVLKSLIEEQNKIEGVEARVVSLRSKVDAVNSPYFDELSEDKMEDYLLKYKPDVAIFHTIYYIKFVKFARHMKELHIPFIIEPHGSFGKQAMKKSHIKKIVAIHTLFKSLVKDSIGYIYTNIAEKEDSVFSKEKESIVPNGVIKSLVLEAKIKSYNQQTNPIFYYLGRYDIHHKGLDYLMDALSILDEKKQAIKVCFYGVGNKTELSFINGRINNFKYVKALEKGIIYGPEKKKALEEAHILLLTSRYEGSPMTVLDGFCYGNPCVVTPGTNVADEVVDNGLGWKAELTAESIAECIVRAKDEYVSNPQTYFSRCQRYVLDNYTWEMMAKLSVLEYRKMLS